jgi:hypothetical protein
LIPVPCGRRSEWIGWANWFAKLASFVSPVLTRLVKPALRMIGSVPGVLVVISAIELSDTVDLPSRRIVEEDLFPRLRALPLQGYTILTLSNDTQGATLPSVAATAANSRAGSIGLLR